METERTFQISINYRPPVKGGTHDDEPNRKSKLREEASRQLPYQVPKKNKVKITVRYYRGEGADDSLNILSGIADALEKTAYDNDRQARAPTVRA